MNFNELKHKSLPHFLPIKIDLFLSRRKRKVLRMALAVFALLSFSFSFDSLPLHFGSSDGFFFLFLISFLILFFIELFYRSMIGEGFSEALQLDYALSELIFGTDDIDASRALFESKVGLSVLGRLGIPREISQRFIYENRLPVVASSFEFASNHVSLSDYISLLYENDKSLQVFLSKNSITKEMLLSAAKETSSSVFKRRNRERFWTKESLGSIPSLGSNFFFEIATSSKNKNKFLNKIPSSELDIYSIKADEEVSRLEYLLASGKSVALVSDSSSKVEEKVRALHKKMALGVVSPEIEHKKLLSLEGGVFFDSLKPAEYESELSKIFSNDLLVERIIFIPDFTGFLLRLREAKVDVGKVIGADSVQLVVYSNQTDYKFFVETHKSLYKKFESITIS